jgi:uncharacterized membrane protein
LLLAAAFGASASAQTIIDLGVLPGGTTTLGGSISADGSVVAGNGDVAGGSYRGWRWTAATGKVNIGVTPGSDHSYAYGMSGNGLVVIGASGASTASSYDTATRWTAATGNQSLGSISPGQPSFASDASFDGSTIIGYGYIGGGNERAWKWTSSTGMQAFGQLLPGTNHSVGLSCSSDGSQMTGYCFNNAPALIYPTGCVWDSAGIVTSLGTLPGSNSSVPSAMSSDGAVVVGYCTDSGGGPLKAFRWSAATGMEDLGAPIGSADGAVAGSLTADGGTVVGYAFAGTQNLATIWTRAQGTLDLAAYLNSRGVDTTGWLLTNAAISADGSAMTGWGVHNGLSHAWYISLGPAPCVAPNIGTQPVNQTAQAGAPVSFTVGASGTGLTYQWSLNASPIANATSSIYTIPAASQADVGSYTCDIVGTCGTASSAAATLTLAAGCQPPEISSQPEPTTVCTGTRVELSFVYSGSDPMTFQWRLNGAEIDGATEPTLVIEQVSPADAGSYDCVLENDCGDTDTDNALLTVEDCAPPCPADFNQDGGIDGQDVEAFFTTWESGDAAADVNADGGVDGGDIETFFVFWEAGGC